jgi:hypothetical protein
MRIATKDIPIRVQAPGAIARQQQNFGDASGYGPLGAEFISFAAGTDITPLLKGLEQDACQSPHWGYLVKGRLTVIYTDGSEEIVAGGDLFYWPPGHSVRVSEDADIVLFSPQHEHGRVFDHINEQLRA